jgi:PAS domain S-box-containing protein
LRGTTRPPLRQVAESYGVPIAMIVAVTLVRVPVEPILRGRAPYALFYLPILVAAWRFGVGPTLVAIVLSLASAWAFVIPHVEAGYDASILLFLVVSAAMLAMARATRARADLAAFREAVIESSDDAIITKDLDGIIRSWNGSAERIFGYTAAEIVGHPVTTIIPPELQDEEVRILERLRHGQRIDHFETVRLTKGGERIHISLTVSPVRGVMGEILGASKVVRDISDRKRAQEQIAAEREWLDRTLQSIGDAVIATDQRGRVVFLNPVAERLTGWKAADARDRDCHEVFRIVNEKSREPVESPVTRVLRVGTVVGLANGTILIAADGAERPIDDSGAPILGSDGAMQGVVLVFRDISDRRRTEAERRAAVTERERLLENERTARSEAEHANRSKDEFVAIVSHELRNPLNAILGWTRILTTNPDNAEMIRKAIDVIERSARTQEQLVSDLLDMSRIISGKLRLDVRDVDLIAIINAAIETTRPAAEARRIAVHCVLDPSVAMTTGDPTRLQQCVWNLVSNAIKFTPQGGRVTVSLRRTDSHVAIGVMDNGIGIRSEFLPFVFERFRQAPVGKRSGGLGLGLAIVKQLVELHGGHVSVESEGEGKGATFTLELPIQAVRNDGQGRVDVEGPPPLDHLRVLLVEDDADNREALRTLLEQQHALVTAVATAREALETVATTQPSIVVSDIGLPDIDGYELMRRLRKLDPDAGGRIPAIALTAHASPEDRTKALRTGYNAHIAKPVEPRELVANIISLTGLVGPRTPREGT